ncbi:MAG TPA: adenosylmethionine decarboxylase [Pirellulales bacterium]|nr:adenosylmethionine decarboxylase [Pirellulales bacterium]
MNVSISDNFEFFGRHLLASYTGCDPAALADEAGLLEAMKSAVAASGATLLNCIEHSFKPSGMTAVMLLAESHASIHTYPEHRACFVDLFTCGRGYSAQRFDAELRRYLRPSGVRRQIVVRRGQDEVGPAHNEDWPADWAA